MTPHDGGPLVQRAAASTVASLFAAHARVHPGRVAVEDGARVVTYGGLHERARRLAGALAARGIARGSRVAILSENRVEYLELFLAAAELGADRRVPELAPRRSRARALPPAGRPDVCVRLGAPRRARRRRQGRARRRLRADAGERAGRPAHATSSPRTPCSSSTPVAPRACPRAPSSATAPRSRATW